MPCFVRHLKILYFVPQSHFKAYFNGDSKQILSLTNRITTVFPKAWLCDETHTVNIYKTSLIHLCSLLVAQFTYLTYVHLSMCSRG